MLASTKASLVIGARSSKGEPLAKDGGSQRPERARYLGDSTR